MALRCRPSAAICPARQTAHKAYWRDKRCPSPRTAHREANRPSLSRCPQFQRQRDLSKWIRLRPEGRSRGHLAEGTEGTPGFAMRRPGVRAARLTTSESRNKFTAEPRSCAGLCHGYWLARCLRRPPIPRLNRRKLVTHLVTTTSLCITVGSPGLFPNRIVSPGSC